SNLIFSITAESTLMKQKASKPVKEIEGAAAPAPRGPQRPGGIEKAKKNKNRRKLKLKRKKAKKAAAASKSRNLASQEIQKPAAEETKPEQSANSSLDMSMWESLGVCQQIVAALRDLGFAEPTAIQREAIPAALRDRRDVLGAAETGSGKTLAFGIPVIQRIMTMKSASATRAAAVKQLADIDDDDNDDVGDQADAIESADEDADQSPDEAELAECGWADGDIEEDLGLLAGSLTELGPDGQPVGAPQTLAYSAENVFEDDGSAKKRGGRLYCLVLTPTRELAKQVAAHLQRVAVHTGVTVAAVLGGLSAQRQERLLAGRPDIVVGTPGRLWDLIQSGQPHLSGGLASLPMLVLDEADRLAEPGHFAEMRALLERINANANDDDSKATSAERPPCRRQTLLFSATLTFVHRPPERPDQRRSKLKRMRQLGPDDRAAALAELVGMSGKPKLVDTTRRVGGLTEFRLDCEAKDKDLYLWWLLRSRRGRTLVFCASKDTVRRLHRLLTLLRCPNCRPLHSDMQQRQRLKSLDRFSANPDSVLLATDVAARGLDIPGVEHVVHYQ
uniref:ATP-dependent RNA helicase n=3 Tax=Macrostomum lignano TaxID=282301 RepID=A0A1I8ISD1_9PLAT